MFLSQNLVFIELHKTGCTHIGKLLARFVGGQQIGKHNPAPPAIIGSGRKFLGSVRNPWDWYVSLWAFGCSKQGSVYDHTTAPLKLATQVPGAITRAREWQRCYADARSASAFRDWLYMLHDEKYRGDIGEGYSASSLSRIAGLLSYRYMYLFCRFTQVDFPSIETLKDYERRNCYVDFFIRNEHLEEDFIDALRRAGVAITGQDCSTILSMGRTNVSPRRRDMAYYYDDSTARLVSENDRLVIDRFSYSFSGTSPGSVLSTSTNGPRNFR